MAFLDNSGDIILDAVLTDLGRERMAKGDGSFRIVKFALADDEINYALYDKNNASGSAYYDLEILQSPILEAFTNNASSIKSKLLSIARKDLLYLPVIQIFDGGGWAQNDAANAHIVAVDEDTVTAIRGSSTLEAGVLNGNIIASSINSVRADQGLDTGNISPLLGLDPDLVETQFLVEMDNRLGSLWGPGATASGAGNSDAASISFIDDDQIATYYFTAQTDAGFVSSIPAALNTATSIQGPRGNSIAFRIMASTALRTNDYFFTTLGSAGSDVIQDMDPSAGDAYRFIDTNVSVTGVTTGYRIDIPIRYVKLT